MFALFSGMAVGTVIFVSIFGILLYFVPSFVAWKRKHRQLVPIILVNVFFGWSLIGWVAALVWAFMNPTAVTGVPSANTGNSSEPSA